MYSIDSSLTLSVHADANWAKSPDSHRSTKGECMISIGALIYWKCKSKIAFLNPPWRLNIGLYPLLVLRCWGCKSIIVLQFLPHGLILLHPNKINAIRLASNLVFHEWPKTLNLIVISCGMKVIGSSFFCLMCLQTYNLLKSL